MSNQLSVTANAATRRGMGRLGVGGAALAICLGIMLNSGQHASGQNALEALDNLVPLTELETRTDDLIRLATEYSDALRELKVAQLSIDTVRTLRPNAVITNLEVQIAGLNLQAAERKVKIIRAIAEKQLAAAQDKLEVITYLEGIGQPEAANNQQDRMPNQRSYIRVQDEATVEILKMILAME